MSTMTRTDIHRPSAVEFDPENYIVRGFADFHETDGYRPVQVVSALVDEGYSFRGAPHGSGQCSHCGTRLRYAALISHEPTKTLMYVGETCLGNRFDGTKADFEHLRAEAARKAEQTRREGKASDFFAEYPDMVILTYVHNIDVAGATEEWTLGWGDETTYATEAEAQAAFDALPEWQQKPGMGLQPMRGYKRGTTWTEQTRMGKWTSVLSDMGHKVQKYGSLSAKQVEFARKILGWMDEAEQKRAEREAATQAKVASGVTVPTGRIQVTGTVVSTKWVDNAYGSTLKMLVENEAGWKVWGSVPSSIDVEKGDTVQFTAAVEASNDDPLFGFFKRPTKAQVL